MALLQLRFWAFIVSCLAISGFGKSVHVILGDRVKFLETGDCVDEPAKLYRVGEHTNRLVAVQEQGAWKPEEEYKDRLDQDSFFALSRSRYTDTGLYQFICGTHEYFIQLDVLVGFDVSVKEGGKLELPCYYITAGKHVDSLRWERHGETVLEQSLSTGETKYGTGLEGKVSLSPDGYKQGDWSLVLNQASVEDEGDFYCSVRSKGLRDEWGNPAAVRVKVTRTDLDQTTIHPPVTPTQCAADEKTTWITLSMAAVVGSCAFLLGFLLGWCLKSRCSGDSSESTGGRYPPHRAKGGPCSQAESGV